MTFEEWHQIGITNNWCGPTICYTHDGLPTTADEDQQFDDGDDPCMHILRLYPEPEYRVLIEDNHSPSIWRNRSPQ